jgi:ubiquinone biosynthesis protein
VREWIERNLGPVGRIEEAAGGASELGRFLGQVPALLTRAVNLTDQLDAITRNGLVLAPETVDALTREQDRLERWKVAAFWVIAALLAWLVFLVV